MARQTMRDSRLTRRGFLSGVAASAAAAILAACGGSSATNTPAAKPTTAPAAAPTTAAAPSSAAAAATTAPAVATTAPAASAAAAATKPAASAAAAGTTAPSGSAAAGGTTTAASSGAIKPIPPPAAGAFKGQSISTLARQEYFKGTEQAYDQAVAMFSQLTGATIDNSHQNVDTGDTVAKQDAAVKAGNAPVLFYGAGWAPQWLQLGDLLDVTDVVNQLQDAYGPVEDIMKVDLFVDNKWYGIPFSTQANGLFSRKDWLDEKGIKLSDIKTFENLRDVALQISDPAKNRFGWGMTTNRSGDGNTMVLSVVQAYGGSINSNDGKKVTFNSPETVAAITFLADIHTNAKYKNMLPPGVEGWTDPSNNEAWLAGTLGFTQNAYTLYAQSKAQSNPVYDKTAILPGVLGPGTDQIIAVPSYFYFTLFKGGKNPDLAKEMAKYLISPNAFLTISKPSGGLNQPAYKKVWDTDPFYTNGDPSFPALRQLIEAPLPIKSKTGFTFPQTASAGNSAVQSQYILSDMMGEIIQKGTKVPDAVKTAHDRMVQLFEQLGLKQ
jgi:multiple sugar transport system substrate-binding protein